MRRSRSVLARTETELTTVEFGRKVWDANAVRYSAVAVRERDKEGGRKLYLWADEDWSAHAFVTNTLEGNEESIAEKYDGRAGIEPLIGQLKLAYGMGQAPTGTGVAPRRAAASVGPVGHRGRATRRATRASVSLAPRGSPRDRRGGALPAQIIAGAAPEAGRLSALRTTPATALCVTISPTVRTAIRAAVRVRIGPVTGAAGRTGQREFFVHAGQFELGLAQPRGHAPSPRTTTYPASVPWSRGAARVWRCADSRGTVAR